MKKKILVVEDDIDISISLKRLLEEEGYVAELARNGKVALECLQSEERLPDLIILDLMMPIMDGFQFRQRQLRDSRLAPVPVVIMTAGGNIEAKAASLGARDFIKKPIEVNVVLNILVNVLGNLPRISYIM